MGEYTEQLPTNMYTEKLPTHTVQILTIISATATIKQIPTRYMEQIATTSTK